MLYAVVLSFKFSLIFYLHVYLNLKQSYNFHLSWTVWSNGKKTLEKFLSLQKKSEKSFLSLFFVLPIFAIRCSCILTFFHTFLGWSFLCIDWNVFDVVSQRSNFALAFGSEEGKNWQTQKSHCHLDKKTRCSTCTSLESYIETKVARFFGFGISFLYSHVVHVWHFHNLTTLSFSEFFIFPSRWCETVEFMC